MQIVCSLHDQLVQMSTTHSSFDQYYTASVTNSLATNPGDATVCTSGITPGNVGRVRLWRSSGQG